MSLKEQFTLLANYNQWMNIKVYAAASALDAGELSRERGAFFGSIFGTLNHILVGDIIWLKRFAAHPNLSASLDEVAALDNPRGLDHCMFDDSAALAERRAWLDERIIVWTGGLTEHHMDLVIIYHNTQGVAANRRFSSLLLHFFNHQTHHRGQVSTLLHQAGADIGVTDLLAQIPLE